MLGLSTQNKFYFYNGYTDFRKGFDGLSGLVINNLGADPHDGSVYIFINRRRDKMKLLVWEPNGFTLYYKRLESGTFELPSKGAAGLKISLTWETLILMIQGISLSKIKHRKRYKRAS
jgi:transposase